ncbi:hypothetical protein CsSME_00003844 [Camellia sinensis var. sinensis]|uniref:uncharacterized protein LOC114298341 n=1 Tax=Camellia sinensis TaxID=4442 RepID=UPI001035F043|nr:uncharacterized protein LOC114298341 [Camellia sinensis]
MEFADYPNPVPISDPGPLKSISTRPPSLSSRNPRRRPAFTAGGRDFGVWWLRARVSCEVFANKDIFMYRGDTPFCSEECKQQQIEMDEANEKNWKIFASMKALRIDQKKPNKSFSPKKTQNYAFLLCLLPFFCFCFCFCFSLSLSLSFFVFVFVLAPKRRFGVLQGTMTEDPDS